MKQATRSGLTLSLYRLHIHNIKHVPIVRKGVLSDSVAVAVIRLNTGRLGPTTAHRPRHAVAANRPGRPGVERRRLSGKRRRLEEGGHRAKECAGRALLPARSAVHGTKTCSRHAQHMRLLFFHMSNSIQFLCVSDLWSCCAASSIVVGGIAQLSAFDPCPVERK